MEWQFLYDLQIYFRHRFHVGPQILSDGLILADSKRRCRRRRHANEH